MRKPIVISVPRHLWREFGLDIPEQYTLVMACLYLGHGPERIRELLSRGFESYDCRETVRVAQAMGLTTADKLTEIWRINENNKQG